MLIAQFSDLHYATNTLPEVDRYFGYAIDRAIEANVDAAVISGDATDHALELHAPAVEALARRVQQLAEHCPVLLLQGTYSHEPPRTLDIFRRLAAQHPIYVADRIQQIVLTNDGHWAESAGWRFDRLPENTRAVFSCLPAVNKADVAAAVGATAAAEAVGQSVAVLLGAWGVVNRQARLAGIATVGVSHGTVSGCVTEHGVPMAGLDHEFTATALFSAETSAFLLGHIHKHQFWREGARLVAYPGSIGRLHYGEEDDKGFILWTVDANGASLDFVPTPARRMVHLDFAANPDIDAVKAVAARAQGAYVRVRWSVAEEEQGTVDRAALLAALAGAAEVKLEGRVIPVMRSRAEGISQAHSLGEKVRRWAQATGVEVTGLLARLERMEAADVDQIVREISLADRDTPNAAQDQTTEPDPDNDTTAAAMIPVNLDGDEALTTAAPDD